MLLQKNVVNLHLLVESAKVSPIVLLLKNSETKKKLQIQLKKAISYFSSLYCLIEHLLSLKNKYFVKMITYLIIDGLA